MANVQYYDVILKPVVTEKSMEPVSYTNLQARRKSLSLRKSWDRELCMTTSSFL